MRWLCAAFGAGLLLAATQTASADLETVTLEEAERQTTQHLVLSPSGVPLCFPETVEGALVHVVGTYRGGKLLDQASHPHPTAYFDVRVQRTRDPAFLVLTAYEPVVWRVRADADAQIAGVFLGGHYPQRIVGLPRAVAVGRIATEPSGPADHLTCEAQHLRDPWRMNHASTSIVSMEGLLQASELFRQAIGAEVASFQTTRTVETFSFTISDPVEGDAAVPVFPGPDSPTLTVPDGYNPRKALRYFRSEAYIKIGPPRELREHCWSENAARRSEGLDPTEDCQIWSGRAWVYTVLAPLELPPGICRDPKLLFLVPPRVPAPKGEDCLAQVYRLRTFD